MKALVTIRIILYALVSFIYLLGVVIIGFGNVAMGVPFGKGLLSFTLASAFLELIVYIYLNLVPRYIKWRIGQKRTKKQQKKDLAEEQDLWDALR